MKQEKNKSKKRVVYYLVLTVCVLLLVAATVLTVYYVTGGNKNNILDAPPVTDDTTPPDDGKKEEPSEPSGSESVVRFIAPVEGEQSIEYGALFTNSSLGGVTYEHKAIDYRAEAGTPVAAMADGTVIEASLHPYLGNLVAIDHGDGIVSYYYFIDPAAGISVGDKVLQGQTIGTVSEAHGDEADEGAHLHLEMKLGGVKVNPRDYIGLTFDEK